MRKQLPDSRSRFDQARLDKVGCRGETRRDRHTYSLFFESLRESTLTKESNLDKEKIHTAIAVDIETLTSQLK